LSARQVVLRAYERALRTRHPMDWLGVEYAVSLHLGHRAYVHLVRVGLASYLAYLLQAEDRQAIAA
jgi:hypothetical protein